jgi:hypothetical protein
LMGSNPKNWQKVKICVFAYAHTFGRSHCC